MRQNKFIKQAGFSAVEAVLILAVVGLVGFIGWRIYDQNKKSDSNSATQNQTSDTPIEKAEDLDAEVDELNNQDIDEDLNTSDIDSALE